MTDAEKLHYRFRGQPLVILVALLGCWIGARAMVWQSPFPRGGRSGLFAPIAESGSPEAIAEPGRGGPARAIALASQPVPAPRASGARTRVQLISLDQPVPTPEEQPQGGPPVAAQPVLPAEHAAGVALVLAAGLSRMELPPHAAAAVLANSPTVDPPPAARPAGPRRWSGDGWLLLRRDSTGVLAAGEPSYGRSQAGAVLRYALAPSSGHRPVAYVRATGALAGPHEQEVATGFAARPIARVPVSVAGEVRAYDGPTRRELRPAAFAVTELPPAKLPFGVRAEAYIQAGYVGGSFATAFVDGQARVDAKLAVLGRSSELRVGGGVWGGAQKETARLDIGPSATVGFRLGQVQSRLALDYRWRIAGNAEPRSGPALTISAGF